MNHVLLLIIIWLRVLTVPFFVQGVDVAYEPPGRKVTHSFVQKGRCLIAVCGQLALCLKILASPM